MRTVNEAMAWLAREIKWGRTFQPGWCKRECREAYLIDSDGSSSASQAWERTDHRFTGQWVRGAFIWWTGGSDGDGHVAICRWRRGHIRTVDHPHTGRWNNSTVADLEAAWPRIRYAGMSLDIDGRKVRRLPAVRRAWRHP